MIKDLTRGLINFILFPHNDIIMISFGFEVRQQTVSWILTMLLTNITSPPFIFAVKIWPTMFLSICNKIFHWKMFAQDIIDCHLCYPHLNIWSLDLYFEPDFFNIFLKQTFIINWTPNYSCVCIYIWINVCLYIYIEREREIEKSAAV